MDKNRLEVISSHRELLDLMAQVLYAKKALNLLALDLRSVASTTDFVVIAEGNVERHVKALCDALLETMEPICGNPSHVEGRNSGEWVVIDYQNIMVHLMTPDMRQRYALEQLWRGSLLVDLTFYPP